MGRAFPEVVTRELASVPGVYAIGPERLHDLDAAFGKRPSGVPGVSSEHALALASGANRIGYGAYWLHNGRLEARLTLEELPAGKMTRVFSSSAAGDDVLGAASALAQQLSNRATSYPTRNVAAVKAYVMGLELADPATAPQRFEEAIAADPAFAPPYEKLAQWKIQRQDRAGATDLLSRALAQSSRMPELERVQIGFNAAALRGDAAARQQALAAWSQLTPNDPTVWRIMAESAMSRREYAQSDTL